MLKIMTWILCLGFSSLTAANFEPSLHRLDEQHVLVSWSQGTSLKQSRLAVAADTSFRISSEHLEIYQHDTEQLLRYELFLISQPTQDSASAEAWAQLPEHTVTAGSQDLDESWTSFEDLPQVSNEAGGLGMFCCLSNCCWKYILQPMAKCCPTCSKHTCKCCHKICC